MPGNRVRAKVVGFKIADEHATIYRLFHSKHVRDLQLIIWVSFFAVLLTAGLGTWIARSRVGKTWTWEDAIAKGLKYGGPALVVFGGVVSWAYKTGSSRLGVVDLFACEISTLCRVLTVVEAVRACVSRVDHPPTTHAASNETHADGVQEFTSQENYFPVFESNNQALQTLEAKVVINITAFYTYMKAFRDSLRTLAQISPATGEVNDQPVIDVWRTAAGNSVYMLFLSLESARKSVFDLIEFEPEQAENLAVVLLSELDAFQFLREKYANVEEDNIYRRRIELRVPDYKKKVPKLIKLVDRGYKSDRDNWEKAHSLLDELRKRYHNAIGVS